MRRMLAWLALLRAGNAVADPKKWKKRQITATMLVPIIAALIDLSRQYGYDIPLDHESIVTIAMAVVVVGNVIFTITTSRTIGLPADDVSGVAEEAAATPPAGSQDISGATHQGGDPKVQRETGSLESRPAGVDPFADHGQ